MTEQVKNMAEIEAQESVEVSPVETPTEAPENMAPEVTPEVAPDTEPEVKDNSNREAAKYRRQLREVEAERDQLREELTTQRDQARKAVLQEVLSKTIAIPATGSPAHDRNVDLEHPNDIFTLGYLQESEVWGEDGSFKQDKIREAVTVMFAERPNLFKRGYEIAAYNRPVKPIANIEEALRKALTGSSNPFDTAFEPK